MLLSDCKFICFDFETTGISSSFDKIIDIGAVKFSLEQHSLRTYSQLVDPRQKISAAASHVHGIYDKDVVGAPVIEEVLPSFLNLAGTDDIMIAHNASFDRSFLANACGTNRLPPPSSPVICTLPLCRRAWPSLNNYRLETIGQQLGFIETEEHRGLADSLLLRDVFLAALQELKLATVTELFEITRAHFLCPAEPPAGFELFDTAIGQQRDMAIQYGQSRAFRTITPTMIINQGARQYLMAVCHRDGINKQFRFDRIHEFFLVQQ